MKLKSLKAKFMCLALSATALSSLASCGNSSSEEQSIEQNYPELAVHEKALLAEDGGSFIDSLLDILKTAGKTTISGTISSLAKTGINMFLNELGFDTESITDKKLDQLSAKMDELKELIAAGYSNITRKIVEIHNKEVLDNLLDKIQDVRSPVIAQMAGLVSLSEKELDESYDKSKLASEKESFYKNLKELKFVKVSGNSLWYAAENLANAILSPSQADQSLKLFDLYDETFGALETWDYMTVAPRTQFISYLAMLTNGLAELAQIEASYEASAYDEQDANYIVIKTGVENMAKAVNALNEEFQKQLIALDEIKKDHDESKHMVHRTRTSDAEGNLVIVKDAPISSRLFPMCPGNSEYNYCTFTHSEDNKFVDLKYGQWCYDEYIYTLDASAYEYIGKTIVGEYEQYVKSLGYSNYTEYTIKDYLNDIGFVCYEKQYYSQVKGFYSHVADVTWTEKEGFQNDHNGLKTYYTSFLTHQCENELIDEVQTYTDYIWSSTEYHHNYGDAATSWYLGFIRADGLAFLGNVNTLHIEYVNGKNLHSGTWNRLLKGYYSWNKGKGNILGFVDKHKR